MRALLLHIKSVHRHRYTMIVASFMLLTTVASAQWTYTQNECVCKAESVGLPVYLFNNTIQIQTGSALSVVSANGLYDSMSSDLNDPTPIASGHMLVASGGNQVLEALSKSGEAWEIVVSDGTQQQTISSQATCSIEPQQIKGDTVTCIGNTEEYMIAPGANTVSNIQWSVTGGTIVRTSEHGALVTWDQTAGTAMISYTATSSISPNSTQSCAIGHTLMVHLRDEAPVPLVCNNRENISLNGNCDLRIVADMILEAQNYPNDSYDLEFKDIEADTIISGPQISQEYINKVIQVRVIHDCGGNSCWGEILLEDKSITPLICGDDIVVPCKESSKPENTGYPIPRETTIQKISDTKYKLIGYDNCTDAILSYLDMPIDENLCEGPYSAVYRRHWSVEDASGNRDTCSQLISIERETLSNISFPGHWDDILGPNPSIEACSNYKTDDKGLPHPDLTGRPQGIYCMNAEIQYSDIILEKCGEHSFKVRRSWTVIDLCTDTYIVDQQYITVMDRIAPVCHVPATQDIGTVGHACTGVIEVVPPRVTDCSKTTYTVGYNPVESLNEDPYGEIIYTNVKKKANGDYVIEDLPSSTTGYVYIIYTIVDECGNQSQCHTRVRVIDEINPTPVCLQYTHVSLNENGESWAGVRSFDDGSHDNCGIDTIEIRRMDSLSCGIKNVWGQKVKFCCDDIGKTVMVQLRVTDLAGNTNECMVEVQVQDNLAPVFTHCPKDQTIDCSVNPDVISTYGTATVEDNCDYTLKETISSSIDECGVGIYYRTFTATDSYGNSTTCTQRLFVKDLSPFYINQDNPRDPKNDIRWPADYTIPQGCVDSSIEPESLPSASQKPIVLRETCGRIGIEYKDDVYTQVDGACFKILRHWTVLDWCHFEKPNSTSPGKWTYTQVIKVENNVAPEFTKGCMASEYKQTLVDGCKFWVTGQALASDDCKADAEIQYSYELDINRNGHIDKKKQSASFNEVLERGTHKVIWYATDQCGNTKKCEVLLDVKDTKPPSPYCHGQIVTVVMETSGSVELWAKDFDLGSNDNCFDSSELKASFDKQGRQTNRTFTCADIEANGGNIFHFPLYITDPDGNQDFCEVNIKVQDNNNACDSNTGDDGEDNSTSKYEVSGKILFEDKSPLPGTIVEAYVGGEKSSQTTGEDGSYLFSNVVADTTYSIIPKDRGDYRKGINTRDLIMIQRHLLGQQKFTSPYEYLAADADGSKSIDPRDLLELRKLILNLIPSLGNSPGWRYVDASKTYDSHSIYNYEKGLEMKNMTESYSKADFIAVKVGDVNNSYKSSLQGRNLDNQSTTSIVYEVERQDNQTVYTLHLDKIEGMLGFQYAVKIPSGSIAMVSSELEDFSDKNYAVVDDILYLSYNGDVRHSELCKIHLSGSNNPSVLTQVDYMLASEAYYDHANEIVTHNLELRMKEQAQSTLVVNQNTPNPFNIATTITYYVDTDQLVRLSIHDLTGKLLYTQEQKGRQGSNHFTIHVDDIPVDGVLYYTVEGVNQKETNKMIIIR